MILLKIAKSNEAQRSSASGALYVQTYPIDTAFLTCDHIKKIAKFEIWKLFSKPQIDGCMVVWLLFRGVVLRFITEIQYYYD